MNPKARGKEADTVQFVVAQRGEVIPTSVMARTPGAYADVEVKPVHPLVLVLIRSLRTYLQSVLGFFFLLQFGTDVIPSLDVLVGALGKVQIILLASIFPAIVGFLQNTIEYLGSFDKTHAQWRA